jgi:hypothetical protein
MCRALGALFSLTVVLGAVVAALAWRLAEGPIALPLLASRIEAAMNKPDAPQRLEVGQATIAWAGWRQGYNSPFQIVLRDIRARSPDRTMRVELPETVVTFSFASLVRGQFAPRTIEVRGPQLLISRGVDGSWSLDLGEADEAEPETESRGPGAVARIFTDLMLPVSEDSMMGALRSATLSGGRVRVIDRQLRRAWSADRLEVRLDRGPAGGVGGRGHAVLRLEGEDVPVDVVLATEGFPARIGIGVSMPSVQPAVLGRAVPVLAPLTFLDASVAVEAEAVFDVTGRPLLMEAGLRAGPGSLGIGDGRVQIAGIAGEARIEGDTATLGPLRIMLAGAPAPAAVADPGAPAGSVEAAPGNRGGEAPSPRGDADPARRSESAPASRNGESPSVRTGDAPASRHSGTPSNRTTDTPPPARAELAPLNRTGDVPAARVEPGPTTQSGDTPASRSQDAASSRPGGLPTARSANGFRPPAQPTPAAVAGPVIDISGQARRSEGMWRGALDIRLDRVPFTDLARHWPDGVAPGARRWMSQNITAGLARDGSWRLSAEIAQDFAAARVTGLTGTLTAEGATVHWLRPVPPAEAAGGVASFSLDAIDIRIAGAQQSGTAVQVRDGTMRITGIGNGNEETAMELRLSGPVADVMGVLKHPRLRLFERQATPIPDLFGQITEARLSIGLPLIEALPIEDLRIGVQARIEQVRIPTALLGRDIERGVFDLTANTEGLRLAGNAVVAEVPARLAVEMDFRRGTAQQVVMRESISARVEANRLAAFGLDVTGIVEGAIAIEARQETRRGGMGRLTLRADLREAGLLAETFGWTKARGTPGAIDAVLRFQAGRLQAIESVRAEAPGALLRARAAAVRENMPERLEIQEARLGQSRFTGEVRSPTRPDEPWGVTLAGPTLDLGGVLSRSTPVAPAPPNAAPDASGPAFEADLRFERVLLGTGRDMAGLVARARVDAAGVVREARASGGAGSGTFEIAITPQGGQRQLTITAADAGTLLRDFDVLRTLYGGRLNVTGRYDSNRPGATLSGTAEITDFSVRDPTTLGKLLQAMTLYGLFEAASGPGLVFARMTAPFRLSPGVLELEDARAFSASLGLTARGRIDRRADTVDMQGTIVPAYFFNSLLGNIPLLGRIFSPEAGGGVFAATYRIRGPIGDPAVSVNALAALTPGFLRGIFGLAEQGPGAVSPVPPAQP